MIRKFEVRYREQRELTVAQAQEAQRPVQNSANGLAPFGPVVVAQVTAEVEQEARAVFDGFCIVSLKDLGPVIEPWQQWLNTEQACAYLGCSKTTFYDFVITPGKLKKPANGDPLYSRKDLDAIAADGVGKAKKKKKIQFPKAA